MPEELEETAPDDDPVVEDADSTVDDLNDTSGGDDEPAGKAPVIDGDFDAERAKRLIANLRKAEAAQKAKAASERARADETLRAVQKALGIETDKPDPAALQQRLAAAEADRQAARRDMQVMRVAPRLGADPDALTDSLAFRRAMDALDPDSDTFADDVEDAIRAAVDKNAKYKLATVTATQEPVKPAPKRPGRSGTDMAGAGALKKQVTQAELDQMTPQQIVAAQDAGLLRDLLGGK